MANFLEQLDAKLAEVLSGWNLYTAVISLVILGFLVYPLLTWKDPDTHPLVLARQATAAPVRQSGESAVYRSLETPHGYPLKTGLNVKDPGAPRWSSGRDGDLRDVWRQASGEVKSQQDEKPLPPGKILTVYGREEVIEHSHEEISKEINIIGNHIQQHGGKRVAIYLPNSIEFLTTLFASAFYGLDAVLIPFNQPHDLVVSYLVKSNADCLVAEAGALPLENVIKGAPGIRQAIWVVQRTSRHMDWNEVPEGAGGKLEVAVWHDVVQDQQSAAPASLPDNKSGTTPGNVVAIYQKAKGQEEIIEFTQENIVAAVGAIISALPPRQRINPSDSFLPADSLTSTYCLTHTLAALLSHASVAINSVAGPGVDLALTSRSIAPTIVVVSAETALKLHSTHKETVTGMLKQYAHHTQTQALTSGGYMPTSSVLTRLTAPKSPATNATPGKLRIIFVAARIGSDAPPLSSSELSDLRVFTGARVIYALTTARVFGAVTQTHLYDYRVDNVSGQAQVGTPLACLEIKVKDTAAHKTTDEKVEGEVFATGASVQGGSASLGIVGKFRDDNTLVLL
ncbi:MAG: hypothetical protein M1821_005692 [Bathelium mastoideum]|nr:MAG: hypothetical protein M1821_005692 [Bathelium mastoideum]